MTKKSQILIFLHGVDLLQCDLLPGQTTCPAFEMLKTTQEIERRLAEVCDYACLTLATSVMHFIQWYMVHSH